MVVGNSVYKCVVVFYWFYYSEIIVERYGYDLIVYIFMGGKYKEEK